MQAILDFFGTIINLITNGFGLFINGFRSWVQSTSFIMGWINPILSYQPVELSPLYGFLIGISFFALVIKIVPFIG